MKNHSKTKAADKDIFCTCINILIALKRAAESNHSHSKDLMGHFDMFQGMLLECMHCDALDDYDNLVSLLSGEDNLDEGDDGIRWRNREVSISFLFSLGIYSFSFSTVGFS